MKSLSSFLPQAYLNNFSESHHGIRVYKYEKDKQVAFITLNRPDRLNAIGPEIYRDWTAALDEAEKDDDVKVIVFKGAGRASARAPTDRCGFVYGMKIRSRRKGKQRIPLRVNSNSTGASSWISQKNSLLQETDDRTAAYLLSRVCVQYRIALRLVNRQRGLSVWTCRGASRPGGMTITPIMILRCGFTRAMELCLTGRRFNGIKAAQYQLINKAVRQISSTKKSGAWHTACACIQGRHRSRQSNARDDLHDMGIDRGLVDHYICTPCRPTVSSMKAKSLLQDEKRQGRPRCRPREARHVQSARRFRQLRIRDSKFEMESWSIRILDLGLFLFSNLESRISNFESGRIYMDAAYSFGQNFANTKYEDCRWRLSRRRRRRSWTFSGCAGGASQPGATHVCEL